MKSAIFAPQVLKQIVRLLACALATVLNSPAIAQPTAMRTPQTPQPGLWAFKVATDTSKLPFEMHQNFPDVAYERCLTAEDIASPRAFGLQTSPKMEGRCTHPEWNAEGDTLRYRFECDGGQTLSGSARGTLTRNQVTLDITSSPIPVVRGVSQISQQLVARRIGVCREPQNS